MTTILIILGIILTVGGAFLLIKKVNRKSKKRERKADNKLDLTIKIPLKKTYSNMEGQLMLLIDKHRVKKDLKLPDLNDTISTVCQEHSLGMAKNNKVSHKNAYLRTQKLRKVIGIKHTSEVVAYGQGTAQGILKMWLKSPTHKKTIEGKDWTKFGLSIEKKKRNYTTCIFTK